MAETQPPLVFSPPLTTITPQHPPSRALPGSYRLSLPKEALSICIRPLQCVAQPQRLKLINPHTIVVHKGSIRTCRVTWHGWNVVRLLNLVRGLIQADQHQIETCPAHMRVLVICLTSQCRQ